MLASFHKMKYQGLMVCGAWMCFFMFTRWILLCYDTHLLLFKASKDARELLRDASRQDAHNEIRHAWSVHMAVCAPSDDATCGNSLYDRCNSVTAGARAHR